MVLLVSGFVFASVRDDSPTLPPSPKGNVVSGSAQKVIITEKNSNYYPQEINVKANQPVEITLDYGYSLSKSTSSISILDKEGGR